MVPKSVSCRGFIKGGGAAGSGFVARMIGVVVGAEKLPSLGGELLQRLPGELARLHMTVLPPAHGGESYAEGVREPLLRQRDTTAPGADHLPGVGGDTPQPRGGSHFPLWPRATAMPRRP